MKRYKIFLVFMLTFVLLSTNVFAIGENIPLQEIEEIEKELRGEGVKEGDIDNLINKLVNGNPWDSMNPMYDDLAPQIQTPNYSKTVYPDGSFKIVEVEEIQGEYAPYTIWNRKGYKVEASWGIVRISFKVDYERNDLEKLGRITSQYSYEVYTLLGIYEEDTKGYLTGWRNPTNAWYAIKYKATQDAAAKRYFIKIFVDGDGTWTDYSN